MLAALIEDMIGDGFKKDALELEKLSAFVNDESVLRRLDDIKQSNKKEFAEWLERTQGITVNPNSIFAIQSKRLH